MNEELKVIISAEVTKLRQGVETAKQAVKGFGEQVEKAKSSVEANFKAMGTAINGVVKGLGVGIAAFGAALLANVAATEEYRNQQAQLVTAFETAGASAEQATETYNGLYRVLGDGGQAQEAAQHLAKLTTNQKDLKEWTSICQGVYATFGASLPIESLTEAANETAKTGSLTGALADALNWAGVNEEQFQAKLDACNTEAEREALIRQTLNGLYSEASVNYEKNNAQVLAQRDAQAKLQEKLAALGTALAPVVTAFTSFATEALALVTPYIQDLANNLIPVLQTALENAVTAIKDAATWIKEHETLLQAIAVAIGIVVTAIGLYNTVAAVKAAMAAAEVASVWGLVSAYAAQAVAMAAALAPYLLIAAAIAALIAVIVVCVKNWDDIKAAAVKAWEGIKAAWGNAKEWFSNVWEGIKGAFANVGEWFTEKFTAAKQGIENAWSNTKTFFSNKYKDIQNSFQSIDSWMSNKFGSAWTGVKQAFSPFVNFFKQSWESVKGIFSAVKSVLTGNFSDAWQSIKGVFSGWGSFFSGLWQTIKNTFTNVGQAIGNAVSGTVKTAINAVLRGAVSVINGFISAINFAIGVINAIPGVNISKLSKLNVPQMAKGGIVDSATLAVIGEQGKEAVLPLENNLEYLDKLAGMITSRMGGGNQPIVLNVDGKRFAEISVDSINSLTRQRGSIPLVMA